MLTPRRKGGIAGPIVTGHSPDQLWNGLDDSIACGFRGTPPTEAAQLSDVIELEMAPLGLFDNLIPIRVARDPFAALPRACHAHPST
jgi:hypothetical protein